MNFNEMYDYLIELGVATIAELNMACHFGGSTTKTLEEVLYYKTGYSDFESFMEEND